MEKNKKAKKGLFGMVKIVLLGLVVIVVIAGTIGWQALAKEHREAKNLPIEPVDFRNLKDGTYIGEYEGGMYKWRTNEVQVTVSSGKVTDIKLLEDKAGQKAATEYAEKLYDRIIQSQSLQVDTVSGATLTSKAYLKAVEIALRSGEK